MTARYYTYGPLDVFLNDREAQNFNTLANLYVLKGIRFSPSDTSRLEGIIPDQAIRDFKYVCVLISLATKFFENQAEIDAFEGYLLSKKH